jgi:hypothetical protein
MVLCLEKELRYDNPGRHDPKQHAMRINDSLDCKPVQGRPAQSKPTRVARRFCPRVSTRTYLSGATPMRSRTALTFSVCRSHATMT